MTFTSRLILSWIPIIFLNVAFHVLGQSHVNTSPDLWKRCGYVWRRYLFFKPTYNHQRLQGPLHDLRFKYFQLSKVTAQGVEQDCPFCSQLTVRSYVRVTNTMLYCDSRCFSVERLRWMLFRATISYVSCVCGCFVTFTDTVMVIISHSSPYFIFQAYPDKTNGCEGQQLC